MRYPASAGQSRQRRGAVARDAGGAGGGRNGGHHSGCRWSASARRPSETAGNAPALAWVSDHRRPIGSIAERAPRLRRFANSMADFWVSWAAGCPIRDTQSGFRLYPATLLRELPPPHGDRRGFVFESELLIRAAHQGYRLTTVAVTTLYLAQSRPSHYQPWRDTWRITVMVAWELIKRGLYPLGLLRSLGIWPGGQHDAHSAD